MPAKRTASKAPPKEPKKRETKKEEPTVIERLLGLRGEIENELDGRHSDLVTVGLNACSRAIGLLGDNIDTERRLVRP